MRQFRENFAFPPLPGPNPTTRARHRKQLLRQITLPLFFGALVVIAVVVWLYVSGIGNAETWAQITTIFLLLPVLVLSLIPLAVAIALIYGVTQILSILPPYAHQAQLAIDRIERQIKSGADISVAPVLKIQSFLAVVDTIFGRNSSRSGGNGIS
jgi:hypothetical protein